MVLWQAIALAGGLSMIGAMLVYGLEPIGDNLIAGLKSLAGMVFNNEPTTALGFWHLFALSAAALLTAHLVFTLLLTYYKIERQRRRHRELLALLASPSDDGPGTVVINHDSPVAYCLPGGARSVTVLSDGLMAALEPAELGPSSFTKTPTCPSATTSCCGPSQPGARPCPGSPPPASPRRP